MNELLTVAEFAKAANISNQAVYQALNKHLKSYLVMVGKRKMLKSSALFEIYGINPASEQKQEIEQAVEQLDTTAVDNLNNEFNKLKDDIQEQLCNISEKNTNLIEHLQDEVTYLRNQLQSKDMQINSLIDRMTTLIDQQQKLQAALQNQLTSGEDNDKSISEQKQKIDVEETKPRNIKEKREIIELEIKPLHRIVFESLFGRTSNRGKKLGKWS